MMGITSDRLAKLKLIDEILPEPLGGAHRDPATMCSVLKHHLVRHLTKLRGLSSDELLKIRYDKLRSYGLET